MQGVGASLSGKKIKNARQVKHIWHTCDLYTIQMERHSLATNVARNSDMTLQKRIMFAVSTKFNRHELVIDVCHTRPFWVQVQYITR